MKVDNIGFTKSILKVIFINKKTSLKWWSKLKYGKISQLLNII
jgi:hypothetical protein